MHVIQLNDDKTYGDVLYWLHYKIGGAFHSRPERTLIVNEQQFEALQQAGLVKPNGRQEKKRRGKKTG